MLISSNCGADGPAEVIAAVAVIHGGCCGCDVGLGIIEGGGCGREIIELKIICVD